MLPHRNSQSQETMMSLEGFLEINNFSNLTAKIVKAIQIQIGSKL